MSMKEALKKIQKDLESAQAGIAKLYDLVDDLEKTVGGGNAVEAVKPAPARKKVVKAKPKAKAAPKGTATEKVLGLIEKSPEGISIEDITKQTGMKKNTVYGILKVAKKQKKLKSPKRGTYAAV
jgi:hypothetical protein